MKILHKYVLKEHLGPLLFSLSTLTSLLLLNYIAKRLIDLVGKGLPWDVLLKFFGLSIPFTVALTLPMAVMVSTLYAFSRLAAESEITALRASGISLRSILTPVLLAAFGVTLLMIVFNDQIMPSTNHTLAKLQDDIARTKPTFALREQVINEIQPGRLYLRTNHIEEQSNKMREVTIYDLSDPSTRRTIYADSGNLAIAPNQTDLLMTLYNGSMQDVPTSNSEQLQRLFFDENMIAVKGVTNQYKQDSGSKIKGYRELTICETQAIYINRLEDEFARAQTRFVKNLAIARETGVELPEKILKRDTVPHSKFSLGGAYCAFVEMIGLKSWGIPDSIPPEENEWMTGLGRGPYGGLNLPTDMYPYDPDLPDVHQLGLPDSILYNPLYADSVQRLREAQRPKVDAVMLESDRMVMADRTVELARNQVEIHKKFALAAACFVFCLLGAPIALKFPRGGIGMTIGVSLIIFALYYVGLIAGSSLAIAGKVPAWAAMWAANFLFTVIAIYLLTRMRAESSSARGGGMAEYIDNLKLKWQNRKARKGQS